MPDQDDLRFTMELKDEFTAVFNKITDTVNETVPKLKASIGGMGKALAVVGGGLAIGGAVYGAWNMFKRKIADVTKEAEALEATLGNILGSKGAAKNVLAELADSDLTKIFKVKDIDEAYTSLANHGLKATLAQMKSIGDLSANTGKGLGAVVNAIISGGEGKIQGLQNLGIDVVKNKNKKAGIDNLTLSFRGQTQTIKNNSAAIQEYLLNLGMIPGVQGSMAKSADTVVASENNLDNQLDKVWGSLAERFNPQVVASNNNLSKWVATINSWIEIPTSEKIKQEIDKLSGLRAQLGYTNTSEKDRHDILQKVKEIQPDIVDNTKSEKEQLDDLTDSLDKYISKRRQQIALEQLKEASLGDVANFQEALNKQNQSAGQMNLGVGQAIALGFDPTGMSQGVAQMKAAEFLRNRIAAGKETNYTTVMQGLEGAGGTRVAKSDERDALKNIEQGLLQNQKAYAEGQKYLPGYEKYLRTEAAIKKLLPGDALDTVAGTTPTPDESNGTKTSIDKGGIASVNGGGQIKNVNITIQNLVSGGVNIQTTTLKEGMAKAKDIVIEGLLTAVNDANLVGN